MHQTKDIPVEFLRECFEYNPETGILTWKERPESHFIGSRAQNPVSRFNTRYAGKQVGTLNRGYLQTRLHIKGSRFTTVNVHRICWALATGEWPKGEIDHINGIHDDNRLCNLRDATRLENQLNPNNRLRKNNKSGYRGVYKYYGKWRATRNLTEKSSFDTPEEASRAYLDAISKVATKKP
jgi:hypothetical protein